jgi:hypothetical protein
MAQKITAGQVAEIKREEAALKKTSKEELVRIYGRSHRVCDLNEVARTPKPWLIGDILRDRFGGRMMDYFYGLD